LLTVQVNALTVLSIRQGASEENITGIVFLSEKFG
jgi:hypothetical protein